MLLSIFATFPIALLSVVNDGNALRSSCARHIQMTLYSSVLQRYISYHPWHYSYAFFFQVCQKAEQLCRVNNSTLRWNKEIASAGR